MYNVEAIQLRSNNRRNGNGRMADTDKNATVEYRVQQLPVELLLLLESNLFPFTYVAIISPIHHIDCAMQSVSFIDCYGNHY